MTILSTQIPNRQPLELVTRLLTVADLAAMPSELPSGTVKYELDNGRLVIVGPNDVAHGSCHVHFGAALLDHCEQRALGTVLMSTGVILWRSPDRCVGPDLSFVSNARFPIRTSPEDYLETIPDLIVEIRSRSDTVAYLERKAGDYLQAGVRVVWVVDGQANSVIEHRASVSPTTFSEKDILTCEDVIPGFRLSLAELFKE